MWVFIRYKFFMILNSRSNEFIAVTPVAACQERIHHFFLGLSYFLLFVIQFPWFAVTDIRFGNRKVFEEIDVPDIWIGNDRIRFIVCEVKASESAKIPCNSVQPLQEDIQKENYKVEEVIFVFLTSNCQILHVNFISFFL